MGRPSCGGRCAEAGGRKKIWSDCGVKLTDVKGPSLCLSFLCVRVTAEGWRLCSVCESESENEMRVKRVLGF